MITRSWLRALGASSYLAKRLTQALTIAGRKGRAYAYEPTAVQASVEAYSQNLRIRPKTRQLLSIIAAALRDSIEAETTLASSSRDAVGNDPLAAAMARVSQANLQFETTAKEARRISSDFESYRAQRGQDFKSRNNVVTFA